MEEMLSPGTDPTVCTPPLPPPPPSDSVGTDGKRHRESSMADRSFVPDKKEPEGVKIIFFHNLYSICISISKKQKKAF